MSTHMTVVCDHRASEPWCEARFERVVDLPTEADSEMNRLAAVINLAVAEGWQAVNSASPLTALTYCPEHHRVDVHAPCCSVHGHALTCQEYRRTHFVEVRPCCANDAVTAVEDAVQARARVVDAEPGDRLTMLMPREPNTAFAPSAAVGLVDTMTTLRLPDDTVRPVRVVDAVVLEGNLMVTIEVEPGVIPAADARYVSLASDGEVSLGFYSESARALRPGRIRDLFVDPDVSLRDETPEQRAARRKPERHQCPVCARNIGVYVPRGGDGSMVLFRNHNGRGRARCSGSKREVRA